MLFQNIQKKTKNKNYSQHHTNLDNILKQQNWKDRIKQTLYYANLSHVKKRHLQRAKKPKSLQVQDDKRAACKPLSKLMEHDVVYIQDHPMKYPYHGHYSNYVPINSQIYSHDQLYNTFPYIEYLVQSDFIETKQSIYHEISSKLRQSVSGGQSAQDGSPLNINPSPGPNASWKAILKKYLCGIDALKAIQIYVQLVRHGTKALSRCADEYAEGCVKEVFFHRVSQASEFFKETTRLNKNIVTTIEKEDMITQVYLPKTSKFLFCSICWLYDCGQHSLEERVMERNCTYIAKQNQIQKAQHVLNILRMFNFAVKIGHREQESQQLQSQSQSLRSSKQQHSNFNTKLQQAGQKRIVQQGQEDQQGEMSPQALLLTRTAEQLCSPLCYRRLTREQFFKIKKKRRPIVSPLHRSLIKMGVEQFSYDPCLIWNMLYQGHTSTAVSKKIGIPSSVNRSVISCETVFFYFLEQGNVEKKLDTKLFDCQEDMLFGQKASTTQEQGIMVSVSPSTKQKRRYGDKKSKAKTKASSKYSTNNNNDRQNFKIGNCFHYFMFSELEAEVDPTCQDCCCKKRGFCLPECLCSPQCTLIKKGCDCKGGRDECRTKKCACFANDYECIPGICKHCFAQEDTLNLNNHSGASSYKRNNCRNDMLLRQGARNKNLKIGQSNIEAAGLGAFAGEEISKDDMIMAYSGQIIDHDIDYIREGFSQDLSFYNFGMNDGSALDARFMGNKSRFINHQDGSGENLRSCVMFSQGVYRTVFYSTKNIKKGEELFFDYDGSGKLSKDFKDKYPFIKSKAKKRNTQVNE